MDLKEAKNILNEEGYRLVEGKIEEPIGYFPVSLKRAIDSVLIKLSAKERSDKILRKIIMTESNHLARMYFYNGAVSTDMEKWILDCYNEKVNLKESTEEEDEDKTSDAVNLLGQLHYQICNGGWAQACQNGYVDTLDEYPFLKWKDELEEEFKDSPLLEKIKKAIELIRSAMDSTQKEEVCGNCNGEGSWEEDDEEDEDGYVSTHTERCYSCDGEGTLSVDTFRETDFDRSFGLNDWASDWDSKYYEEIDSDTIDDITKQSHTHSVVLDAIRGK